MMVFDNHLTNVPDFVAVDQIAENPMLCPLHIQLEKVNRSLNEIGKPSTRDFDTCATETGTFRTHQQRTRSCIIDEEFNFFIFIPKSTIVGENVRKAILTDISVENGKCPGVWFKGLDAGLGIEPFEVEGSH